MNDPGFYKIYYIKRSATNIPFLYTPGETIDLTAYLSDSLTELEFDKATLRFKSSSSKTGSGKLVNSSVQFIISGINPATDAILTTLENEPHVFVLEDVEGQYYLFGTTHYKPVFVKNVTHDDPPNSKKQYSPQITLLAPFDLVFCTIS